MTGSFDSDIVAMRPALSRFAYKLTHQREASEDLLSDTVEKALRYRDRFVSGSNLRAWLMTIMRNIFLTGRRRLKWDGGSTDDMLESALPAVGASQGLTIDLADTLKALQELPADQRDAVMLIGAGATYEEAAEELCCSVGTVKSRVSRGRDALGELLA